MRNPNNSRAIIVIALADVGMALRERLFPATDSASEFIIGKYGCGDEICDLESTEIDRRPQMKIKLKQIDSCSR